MTRSGSWRVLLRVGQATMDPAAVYIHPLLAHDARSDGEGSGLIRIGIVDDHPVFRLGLIRTFERERDLEVLWELSSLAELDAMLEKLPVDVVLLDLNLGPDQDALGAIRRIRETSESPKVIVVSAALDWEAAMGSRNAGASGYLPKHLSLADMVETIRGLATPGFGSIVFRDMLDDRPAGRSPSRSLWLALTKREREVLGELRRGRTNREIATRLGVSITTVNKHVQQVLRKLQVKTRSEAIALVAAETSGRLFIRNDGAETAARFRQLPSIGAAPADSRRGRN